MEDRQLLPPLPSLPEWDATQARVLDAADELMVRRGVQGITVAELARRAELSRPTIYRSWNDADDVIRAALLRRVAGILRLFPDHPASRAELVGDILRFITAFRADEVYARLLEDEPEAFTRYTLQRVGSSQRLILQWLETAIRSVQDAGDARSGVPGEMAVMLLLLTQSAVLSHGTVADLIDDAGWTRELTAALDGLLRP